MGKSERLEEDGQERSKDERRREKKAKKRRADAADDANAAGQTAADPAEGAPEVAAVGGSQHPAQEPQAAAGSHDADAATTAALQQGTGDGSRSKEGVQAAAAVGERRKPAGGKPAPVLPWMRVPIAIEASEGNLLEEVRGLDPRLKQALEGEALPGQGSQLLRGLVWAGRPGCGVSCSFPGWHWEE